MVIFVPPQREGTTEITENYIDVQIINNSSKQLTSPEINILSKGLKFTPTPDRPNKQELHEDVLEFTRK